MSTSTAGEYAPDKPLTDERARFLLRRRQVLAALGLTGAAALIGDRAWGEVAYGAVPRAEARWDINPGSNTLVHIFGGLATPGRSAQLGVARPIVEHVPNASAVTYGYSGTRRREHMDLAMQAQRELSPQRTVIIGQSLGWQDAVMLADRIRAEGGQVDLLIGDSGCTSVNAARPGFRHGRNADGQANMISRSGLLNYLKPGFIRGRLVPPLDQRQPNMISEARFAEYQEGIIMAPLAVIGLQADALASFEVENGALEGLATKVEYWNTLRPDLDTFVDSDIAYSESQAWFGGQHVTRVYDSTRRDDNHTSTGFPESLVERVRVLANA